MAKFVRSCPTCSAVLPYSSYKNLWRANNSGVSCADCSRTMPRKPKLDKWSRLCPSCQISIKYANQHYMKRAETRNALCASCTASSYPGHAQTEETKAKIKKNHKKPWTGTGGHWIGKKRSKETCDKLREAFSTRLLSRFGGSLKYNPAAIDLFSNLESQFGWDGIYATKNSGGEFRVAGLGYYVDYYEPNLNWVIEYDESYHSKPKQQAKDLLREVAIVDLLKCKFIRISHTDDASCIHQKIKEVL